jgi:hypothetical protein
MPRTAPTPPRRKLLRSRRHEDTRRLEIEVPAAEVQALRQVAALTGETTLTAVLRAALKAYAWLVTEQQRHRRIISEARGGGDRTELMPLLKVGRF